MRNTKATFSIIVLIAYTAAYTITRQYMWINDNIGALQWAVGIGRTRDYTRERNNSN